MTTTLAHDLSVDEVGAPVARDPVRVQHWTHMGRLLRIITAVVAAAATLSVPTQVALAGPIDLPPDGEARLTISLVGGEDLVGRVELFLTAAGTNMFDSACAPTDTATGAVETYECTGLMQRAHFLEAGGTVAGERVVVQCSLPGSFDDNTSNVVDLRPYPNVLDCTVTIAEPGIRIYAVDQMGDLVDPPASIDLFNLFDGSTSTLDCSPDDVQGSPSLFCDTPPFGEYEFVAPAGAGTEAFCAQRLLAPTQLGFAQDPFLFVDESDPEFEPQSIVSTCVIREVGDTGPGVMNEFFVDIQSSDPGPDLVPQLITDGTDRLSDCVQVFEQGWRCSDLPTGTYTVSATGLLPGQVAVAACFGSDGTVAATFDLAAAPFEINCSVRVDVPQIVFPDFGRDGQSSYVILDSDGNDVGDVCGPSVVDGRLVVACPLPLGEYTVPEQDVALFGLTEFTCSQSRGWFFENTVTLSDEPSFEDSIVAQCEPGQPDRRTALFIQIVNPIEGSQLLLNGVPFEEFEGPGECFDASGGDPQAVTREIFCDVQGARTIVPTIGNVGPERAPTIECRAIDDVEGTASSLQADLTEAQPDWECFITFRARLPDTGPSGETSAIALFGAAFLAIGVALTTLGTRRRFP